MNQDLELMPSESMKVYKLIKTFIGRRRLHTGGCKTFYTPLEWKGRNEEHCLDSLLIMVYDGSAIKKLIFGGYDNNGSNMANTFKEYLAKHGYYVEQGLHWYCGIYKKESK